MTADEIATTVAESEDLQRRILSEAMEDDDANIECPEMMVRVTDIVRTHLVWRPMETAPKVKDFRCLLLLQGNGWTMPVIARHQCFGGSWSWLPEVGVVYSGDTYPWLGWLPPPPHP